MKAIIFLLISCLSINVLAAGLQDSRLVYNETKGGFSTDIISEDVGETLIKVWIENIDGNKMEKVVITPSLFVMAPKSKRRIKILNVNSQIVDENEVLAYVNILSVPHKVEKDGFSTNLAITTKMKLFIRPESMKGLLLKDAVESLKWNFQGGKLQVTNMSPFHIVLAGIKVGDVNLDVDHIAPKSTKIFQEPIPHNHNNLTLSYINDKGVYSDHIKFPIY